MAASSPMWSTSLLLAAIVAAVISAAAALPTCAPNKVNLGTEKIVLALIGGACMRCNGGALACGS